MKKKFSFLMLLSLFAILVSCSKIKAPEDFKVADNKITFTEIEGAKNKAVIAFPSIMVFSVWFISILPSCLFHGILKLLPQKEK